MNTKTCKKCGWVLAVQDPNLKCPICKTKFEEGICKICGQPVVFYRPHRNVCKHCYDTVTRKPDAKRNVRLRRKAVYAEWVEKIKDIPSNYPTLTEEQWLQAVKYFDGCALCEAELVDTRGYFVPFQKGGRYCDWNVVPLCEKCALKAKQDSNYFVTQPNGLTKILNYLEDKLNGAIERPTERV